MFHGPSWLGLAASLSVCCALAADDLSDFCFSPAHGLGVEEGVMRRDPSDVIRVGHQYRSSKGIAALSRTI